MPVRLFRRRYAVFSLDTQKSKFSKTSLLLSLIDTLDKLIRPLFDPSLYVVYYEPERKIGILRCNQFTAEFFKKCKEFVIELDGEEAKFRIIGISGTIKKAKKKFLQRI